MASILVYIESVGDSLKDISLEVLGEGRRIASALGAPLHALIPTSTPDLHRDAWLRRLGEGGADRVSFAEAPEVSGPARWANCGMTLHAACIRLQPVLVLMAASDVGQDIGPRLAARMKSDFILEPDVLYHANDVEFVWSLHSAEGGWCVGARALRNGSVIAFRPGAHAHAHGATAASDVSLVLPVEPLSIRRQRVDYLDSIKIDVPRHGKTRIVVGAGGGVDSQDTFQLVAEFARQLGAKLAATATLCERGIAPASIVIDSGVCHITADMYIACGSSGSSEHLGALSPQTTIVAINNDPDAPIFGVASYGVVGDLKSVVPALIQALGEQRTRQRHAARGVTT